MEEVKVRKGKFNPGDVIGNLTILERAGSKMSAGKPIAMWKCQCGCGRICYKPTRSLTNSDYASCGECKRPYRPRRKPVEIVQKATFADRDEFAEQWYLAVESVKERAEEEKRAAKKSEHWLWKTPGAEMSIPCGSGVAFKSSAHKGRRHL